jgi:hypothetical protein
MIPTPDFWILLVLLCAATWRVTYLFMWEEGPFKVIMHLRALTGVRHVDDVPTAYPDGNVFACYWCLSVWVAIVLTVIALTPAWIVLIPLFASGVAIQVQIRNGKS